jgi:hypothetical protein
MLCMMLWPAHDLSMRDLTVAAYRPKGCRREPMRRWHLDPKLIGSHARLKKEHFIRRAL